MGGRQTSDQESSGSGPNDSSNGRNSILVPSKIEDVLRRLRGNFARVHRTLLYERSTRPAEEVPPAPSGGGRYQEVESVAAGGMGRIYRVHDLKLRRDVVMKVARHDVDSKDWDRLAARFLDEAQITGQLGHPGIVPVYDLDVDENGRPFFTMLRVRGLTLDRVFRRIRSGRDGWTLQRGLQVLVKVCDAVAFAHSKKVIHRDLKPANVMVGRFGEVYVVDWGLARTLGEDDTCEFSDTSVVCTDRTDECKQTPDSPLATQDGAVLGTPAYMSPEQAEGRVGEIGRRADVYSIGAMLYSLLTFRLPYGKGLTPRQTANARRAGPPRSVLAVRPDAPRELAEICTKAMADEPRDRYAAVEDLRSDLEAWLSSRPVSVHETSIPYQAALAMRRNRQLVLTVLAAAIVLAAISAVFLVNQMSALEAKSKAIGERADLYDEMAARDLPPQADRLYPVDPGIIDELESWLARAGALRSPADRWREELARARGDEAARPRALLAAVAQVEARIPPIQDRLSLARKLADPTSFGREHLWNEALAEIERSPAYAGLRLEPIPHLVPLGPDPGSDLQEFWVVGTGHGPVRDPLTRRLRVAEEDAVVLVLVPAGKPVDGSAERTAVSAFLIGKYEVTQAQWRRLMGDEPSLFRTGFVWKVGNEQQGERAILGTHPVESVDWLRASEFARRAGLRLPDHLEWEHAALAGEDTRWPGGAEASLRGRVNLGDSSSPWVGGPRAPWDDGFPVHSPAGSFPPNDFGLHDTLGNVSEWCRTPYSREWIEPEKQRRKHFCGGSYTHTPEYCWPGFPQAELPEQANHSKGLRVALSVQRR